MALNLNFDYLFDVVHLEFEVKVLRSSPIHRILLLNELMLLTPAKFVPLMQFSDLDHRCQGLATIYQVIVVLVVELGIILYLKLQLHGYLDLVLLNFDFTTELELVQRQHRSFFYVRSRQCEAGGSLAHFD